MSTREHELLQKIRDAQIAEMRRQIRERIADVADKMERGEPLSDLPPKERKNS